MLAQPYIQTYSLIKTTKKKEWKIDIIRKMLDFEKYNTF